MATPEVEIRGEIIGLDEAVDKRIKPVEAKLSEVETVAKTCETKIKEQDEHQCPPDEHWDDEQNKCVPNATAELAKRVACRVGIEERAPKDETIVPILEDVDNKLKTRDEQLKITTKRITERIGIDETPKDDETITSITDEMSKLINDRDEYLKRLIAESTKEAVWTRAYINDLPDGSFAYIEGGGKKDEEGKTVPRDLRHLPFKDAQGNIDRDHLANALARLPQTELGAQAKSTARKKLCAAVRGYNREHEDDIQSDVCGVGGETIMQKRATLESLTVLNSSAAVEEAEWRLERLIRLATEKTEEQTDEIKELQTKLEKQGEKIGGYEKLTNEQASTITELTTKNEDLEKRLKEEESKTHLEPKDVKDAISAFFGETKDPECPEDSYWNGEKYMPFPEDLSDAEKALLGTRVIKQLFTEVVKHTKGSGRVTMPTTKETKKGEQMGLVAPPRPPETKPNKPTLGKGRLRDFMEK